MHKKITLPELLGMSNVKPIYGYTPQHHIRRVSTADLVEEIVYPVYIILPYHFYVCFHRILETRSSLANFMVRGGHLKCIGSPNKC